jgi:hypothetical protein
MFRYGRNPCKVLDLVLLRPLQYYRGSRYHLITALLPQVHAIASALSPPGLLEQLAPPALSLTSYWRSLCGDPLLVPTPLGSGSQQHAVTDRGTSSSTSRLASMHPHPAIRPVELDQATPDAWLLRIDPAIWPLESIHPSSHTVVNSITRQN